MAAADAAVSAEGVAPSLGAVFALPHKIAYALGAAGFVITDRLLMTWAFFYYSPPGGAGLPERLPTWSLLGVITVWGLISVLGRVVDGVLDPVIAARTDRSRHPFGRRRIYMLAGVVPLAVCTALVFFPPVGAPSWINAAFAAVALCAFFATFTVFVCPFQALLPDLCHTEKARVGLSTVQGVATLAGAAIVMVGSPLLLGVLGDGPGAYQTVAVAFAGLALLLMLAPIVGIPEGRLSRPVEQDAPGLLESLRSTFAAPGMLRYLVGNVMFWFGFNIVASGVPYMVTVLMGQGVEYSGVVLTATFAFCGVCFPFVGWLALRIGKGRTMVLGALSMAAVMFAVPLIAGPVSGLVIVGLGGFPIAVLMAVPKAILAQLTQEDIARTGHRREAMFYAAEGFVLKLNLGVSSAVLAALLAFGKSADNPLGVQLLGPVTALVLIGSALAFGGFNPLKRRQAARA
jgi:GPH family glycoside/pentoside/hexuronide:cation symporter